MPIGGAFCPLPERLGGSAEEGWSPEQHARLCADLLALKRVAALASWSYSVNTTTATVLTYLGQNGSGLVYAPTPTRNGNGDVSFQWPSQNFEDEYGIEHPFRIRAVDGGYNGAAIGTVTMVWEPIARGVRLRTNDPSGATNGTFTVEVW